MFGGGEEYFQAPPEVDRDALRRFCTFCARLRDIAKPGKKTIAETAALARDVGDSEQAYELIVGTLFRHIKSWTGSKQLACWYVLDKLCKEDRDKYGYTASKYILEIGRDYIPYEDPELGPKYESLVEHWHSVFPRHVVDALWLAKKDRLWAIEHPGDVLQQQKQEEQEWEFEERMAEDEEGLNDFGQPCMDYLQGRCSWGDQCRLFHPPGEEGSLPPECRMGDWKCSACGVINRHYRRRCSNCVREKPQYKKDRKRSVEDQLLTSPDPDVARALTQQFGYDPNVPADAIAQWRLRLDHTTVAEYVEERRAAFKVRILGKKPSNPLEERCRNQKHFPDVDIRSDESYKTLLGGGPSAKRQRLDSVVPPGTSTREAVSLLCQLITERGMHDTMAPRLFSDLSARIQLLSAEETDKLTESQAEAFFRVCKLAYTAWSTNSHATPFVTTFFKGIRHHESGIGLPPSHEEQLVSITTRFLA